MTSTNLDGSNTTTHLFQLSQVSLDKLGMAAAMFFMVLIACLTPLLVVAKLNGSGEDISPRRRRLFVLWVSRLSCFAGGVFLSTGFMDLYQDVQEALDHAVDELDLQTTFPFAPFLTLFGFFVILTIEQIILVYKEYHLAIQQHAIEQSITENHHHHHHHHDEEDTEPLIFTARNPPTPVSPSWPVTGPSRQHSVDPEVRSEHSGSLGSSIMEEVPQSTRCRRWSVGRLDHSIEGISNVPVLHQDCDEATPDAPAVINNTQPSLPSGNPDAEQSSHSHFEDLTAHSNLRVVILLCAMSIHAVFEGLAVGLQTSKQSVTELFVALCLHKGVIAAGIGLNLATSALKRWLTIVACFIFSVASPLGVFLGLLVEYGEEHGGKGFFMVNGVLQGLACGTFFYVVFFEILPHEFNIGLDRMAKVLSLILGFALVSLYLLFMQEPTYHK